ncbi:hypothetical protein ZTR_04350 [Talaromyces verruculosus]|nr:hypothetical protein ZTR_04350 [Talaromyces verruculosus]
MENRIKWLESIIREKCSTVDLDTGTDRIPDFSGEPPDDSLVEASGQNSPQTQSSTRVIQDETQLPNQTREQSSVNNPAPLIQDETQQAHEIGLVSLFRGEDPRYIGPSSGYFFAKRIYSNTGWRGRHGSAETAASGNVTQFPVELLNTPTSLPQQKERDVRASSNYPMSVFKQEMRTRVFWVVYTIDRTLCTMMGRPIGIRDEACEIRFPLDISDPDLVNATANQSTSDGHPTHMSLSIRLFRLAHLNSEIKYVMHSICRGVPSYAYPPVKDIFTWQRDMMGTLEGWYYDALQHIGERDSGTKEFCIAKYHELMILLLRPSPAIPDPADEIFDICSDHAFALLQCFGDLYEKGDLLYSRFIVHSVFLGTLVMLHCIWKFPKTASKFSIDQLMIKFNIAQNILSSIGEHWAEALSARDCIAQLSNVTIQRLLKNQPAASSTLHPGGPFNSVSLRHGDVQTTNLERSSRVFDQIPVTASSNDQGQTSAQSFGNVTMETWATTQPYASTPNPSLDYPNLFDDLLQADLGGWTGMSDIDGLLSDLLNSSHY